jgi:hypothetical protein
VCYALGAKDSTPAGAVYALEGSVAYSGSVIQWLRDNLQVRCYPCDAYYCAFYCCVPPCAITTVFWLRGTSLWNIGSVQSTRQRFWLSWCFTSFVSGTII